MALNSGIKMPKIIYRKYKFKKVDWTNYDAFHKLSYNLKLQFIKAEDEAILKLKKSDKFYKLKRNEFKII